MLPKSQNNDMIKTKMSDHEDPSLCINKTIAHLTCIITVGLEVPEHFQAIVIVMTFWYVFWNGLNFFELFKLLFFAWD